MFVQGARSLRSPGLRPITLIAAMAFLLLGGVSAIAGSEQEDTAAFDALSNYIDVYGNDSGDGWRTVAFQVDDQRYLVVQPGAEGDIYQLGNFDDVFVEKTTWKEGGRLLVDYITVEGKRYRSEVSLALNGDDDPTFTVLKTSERSFEHSLPVQADRLSVPDSGPMTPYFDRPGSASPPQGR